MSSANETATDKAAASPGLGSGNSSASPYRMPALGKTRCYWAVMDSSMTFRYLDPVLQAHMHEQAPQVIGKNLVDFIHPHEKQAAADDFAKFKSSTTIFGSVTRCRYARISYARRVLGAEKPESDPDAHLKCIDEEWVAARIVASLIAENTVLVFFHATQDVDEAKDSDDTNYSEWTNWCGPRVTDITSDYFTFAQQEQLNSAFVACQAEAEPIKDEQSGDVSVTDGTTIGGGQLAYVFQLLNSSNGDILYTWPPTRPTGIEKDLTLHGPVEVGQERYIPSDYANLARAVLDKRREKTGNEAKTSCTKRFQSRHPILNDGNIGNIESVVVTYQAIAFVCFQTGNGYLNSKTVAPMPGSNSLAGLKRKSDQLHPEELDADEVIKRLKAADGETSPWVHDANGNPMVLPGLDGSWNPDASSSFYAAGSYPNMYSSVFGQGDVLGGPSMPPLPGGQYPDPQNPQANSKYIARAKGEKSAQAALLNPKPVVLHKVRKADKGRVCTSCGTANSPEWRKGPSGIKTLCNACGLRYARSQARKTKRARAAIPSVDPVSGQSAIVDPRMPHSAQPHVSAEAYAAAVAAMGPMTAPLTADGNAPQSPYMGIGGDYTNPHSAPLPPLPQGGNAAGSNAVATSYGNTYGAFVNYSPFDNNDWSPTSNHSFTAQPN